MVVKVGDLGLARNISEDDYQTMSNVGTPYYKAPEVDAGHKYSIKVDVYSIGKTTQELFKGG